MGVQDSYVYYAVGLVAIAVLVMFTRRQWRWLWLAGLIGFCWLAALPHGM